MTPAGGRWPWAVCVALLFATLLNYMDRQALAVTLPELKQRYALHEARVGTLELAFGLAFAAGSLGFGAIADRVGPRLLYPVVLAGWSAVGAATALAAYPEVTARLEGPDDPPGTGVFRWVLGCRTLLGLFEAGHWPCALLTVRTILAERHRPLGNGLLQSGASLGAVLVPGYVQVVEAAGYPWTFTFASIGAAGLLWLPAWFGLMAWRPAGEPVAEGPNGEGEPGGSPRLAVNLLLLAVTVSCLNVSWQFLRAWLPLFLQDNQGFSKEATRLATSGYFIASDVGCLLAGVLVGRLVAGGRSVVGACGVGFAVFALLTTAAAAVPLVPAGWLTIGLLWIAGAGILGLHPCYYALTQELPAARVGVLAGGLAAVGWVVSAVFQGFVGTWIKETQSYALGLTLAGLLPLVAVAAVLLMGRRSW